MIHQRTCVEENGFFVLSSVIFGQMEDFYRPSLATLADLNHFDNFGVRLP